MENSLRGLIAILIIIHSYTPLSEARDEWPQLVSVEWILENKSHEDHQLLKSIYSKVVLAGMGSGTLVEQAAPGLLLLYSAGHNFGVHSMGYLGLSENSDIGVIYKENPKAPVVFQGKTIFRKDNESTGHADVEMRPENDFMLGLIEQSAIKISSESKVSKIMKSGDPVFVLGYPAKGRGHLYYSVGKIATSEQIDVINKVSNFPKIDSNIEYLITASAMAGMSGGGVFDQFGNFIGVLVRAGIDANVGPYIRVVRKDYINKELSEKLFQLPAKERENLSKNLPSHFLTKSCADLYR